jgi:hypothetical protein
MHEEPESYGPEVAGLGNYVFGQVPAMANRAAIGPKISGSAMSPMASQKRIDLTSGALFGPVANLGATAHEFALRWDS